MPSASPSCNEVVFPRAWSRSPRPPDAGSGGCRYGQHRRRVGLPNHRRDCHPSCQSRSISETGGRSAEPDPAKRLPGAECRALGFEDSVIWDIGRAGTSRLAGLEPGGNNDAAGLLAMARHAMLSPKKHRLLIMISDGFPTECTVDSLANLVKLLDDRYRIKAVQVAVGEMEAEFVAFPEFTDLTQHEIPVAVRLFGGMVQRILQREYS